MKKAFIGKGFSEEDKVNPELLCNLNSAFELSVRLDQIKKIVDIIDKRISYIYDNRTNCDFSSGQIESLNNLKEEIENETKNNRRDIYSRKI